MHGVVEPGRPRRASRSDERPAIAVDLGGTIEDSWQSRRRWFAARGFDLGRWPRSRNEIIEIIGGHVAVYEEMAAEVYSESNVLRRAPVEGAPAALRVLSQRFRITIVSSRIERQRRTTVQWLKHHRLSTFITDLALLGSAANKLAWCVHAGVQFLIDDDLRHLESGITTADVTRIHYAARPGAEGRTPGGVFVAGTWPDVAAVIAATHLVHTASDAVFRVDR